MILVNRPLWWRHQIATGLLTLATVLLAVSALQAQAAPSQSQSQSSNSQSAQEIPDTPSAVQPPLLKPAPPPIKPSISDQTEPDSSSSGATRPGQQSDQAKPAPPPMPPVETIPPGSIPDTGTQTAGPRNQINPREDLYKISVTTNFVQIPVMVKDNRGRRVDGLLYTDFEVLENGKPQKLTYFSSDPFELSVAILLDLGMADVAVQKVNQTYSSLVGAFSPYDEFALYTYSSTVSQVTDFTRRPERLTAALDHKARARPRKRSADTGGTAGPAAPHGQRGSDW